MLERLGSGSATMTELAEPFGMSLTGIKKHVRVLEEAGSSRPRRSAGRASAARTAPAGRRQAWIEMHGRMLDERLDGLGEFLERAKGTTQ